MKDNYGMVEYAKCQLGRGYAYGTIGAVFNRDIYNQKRKQYPNQYPPKKWTEESFTCLFGTKTHDCIGLFKGYLGCPDKDYNAGSTYDPRWDWSADGTIERCIVKGDIKTIPEIPGILVWKKGHVGCYIGDGKVIEAKGHAYGVIMSNLSDTKWKMWGEHPYITYLNAIQAFVGRLYRLVLNREPDQAGFEYWVNSLEDNFITYTDCAYFFLTSDEFKNRRLSDAEFLDVLYHALFNRDGDAEGTAYWLDALKVHTREYVINCFLSSQEWMNVCLKFGGDYK